MLGDSSGWSRCSAAAALNRVTGIDRALQHDHRFSGVWNDPEPRAALGCEKRCATPSGYDSFDFKTVFDVTDIVDENRAVHAGDRTAVKRVVVEIGVEGYGGGRGVLIEDSPGDMKCVLAVR